MHVDTGEIKLLQELEKLYKTGEEKPEDWEELPETDAAKLELLQSPMNRHERRTLIKFLRKNATATIRDLHVELRNIRNGINEFKEG